MMVMDDDQLGILKKVICRHSPTLNHGKWQNIRYSSRLLQEHKFRALPLHQSGWRYTCSL